MDEPIELPITGVLDLHTFRPRDLKDLVPDYLAACREKGILQVRIIHGKGIGNLRRSVHAILARQPEVLSFTLDHPESQLVPHLGQPETSSDVVNVRNLLVVDENEYLPIITSL